MVRSVFRGILVWSIGGLVLIECGDSAKLHGRKSGSCSTE